MQWSFDFGVGLTILRRKKMLRNVTQNLGLAWILWNNLSKEKWTAVLAHGM
jgi:hypothetical protein